MKKALPKFDLAVSGQVLAKQNPGKQPKLVKTNPYAKRKK